MYLASLKKTIIGFFPFAAAECTTSSSAITVLIQLNQMFVYQGLITDATKVTFISFRIIDKNAYIHKAHTLYISRHACTSNADICKKIYGQSTWLQ